MGVETETITTSTPTRSSSVIAMVGKPSSRRSESTASSTSLNVTTVTTLAQRDPLRMADDTGSHDEHVERFDRSDIIPDGHRHDHEVSATSLPTATESRSPPRRTSR